MNAHSKLLILASAVGLAACAGTAMTRDSLHPIPDHPARQQSSPYVRGTAREADRIAPADEFVIVAEVVRRFYRPMMQQARWIDPKPLAHERSRQADSLVKEDFDWAVGIVDAAAVRRVCPLTDANAQCRGLAGGVLRFSAPYAVGTVQSGRADSALVYARFTPLNYGVGSEIEFFLARREGKWDLVSKRTLPEIAAVAPPKYVILDPLEAVDSLLAADRAFAAAGRSLDPATTITNMFVTNVVMQAPGGFIRGRDSANKAIASNPDNARSRFTWTPIRGGVSSDFQHGFTFGYTTLTRPDGTTQPGKYVAYWIRGEGGWRVAAYKRILRPEGVISLAVMAPSLPTKGLPRGDEATVQRYSDELSSAEHAFARDAGPMGLGPAFEKWGAPDAANNAHDSPGFVFGNQAIAKIVGTGLRPGMTIHWAPEQVMVASTGDLGVSIGTIRITTAATADRPEQTVNIPFFTIWKRAWTTDPWRYVAE